MSRIPPILVLIAMAACNRGTSDAALTVDYYRSHSVEREAMLRTCANDPGTLRNSPTCVNAREAARIEGIGSLKQLAPMGLPGVQKPRPADPAHKD